MRRFVSKVRADPLAGTVVILMMAAPVALVASLIVRFTVSDVAWAALFFVAVGCVAGATVLAAIRRQGRLRLLASRMSSVVRAGVGTSG
ncbi:hypothetical protein GCM10017714_10820 [Curtobacterium pusillum]|uniref:Uncharacterized protein n=1 Tax=Curtobacterium pusillum TaxID=69373 RepID=A0ABX2MAZ1_9MICO|nr:hypothetical protein [Curtobacterium pusillum]NUU12866.1 hypothetical protein [Curtobacterium pusillum]GLK30342.1 hypothetical protein GCM10017610_06270 [Curtobacterium pusillum]